MHEAEDSTIVQDLMFSETTGKFGICIRQRSCDQQSDSDDECDPNQVDQHEEDWVQNSFKVETNNENTYRIRINLTFYYDS